jgi:phosphoribosyl 1,2-cyclic phosphodiesterase
MQVFTLSSGSSGNSTLLVTNTNKKVLIDVGIGINDLKGKLSQLGYTINDIDAVLITHSHIDHIRCISNMDPTKTYTPYDKVNFDGFNYLDPFYEYEIADLRVFVLPTSHDTFNGIGFVIYEGDYKLVYMTDTGYVNQKLYQHLTNADCYIFESNHDEDMLLHTNRPPYLIKRILSDVGHLSNSTCAYTLCRVMGERTKTIFLAHLSEDANTPECAITTFNEVAKSLNKDISNIKLIIAKRHEITTEMEAQFI